MTSNQTQIEISQTLENQRLGQHQSRGDLVRNTGLSYQSLQKILDGTSDFKVSNLLAIAHALDMDVALVPRGLGAAVAAGAMPSSASAAHAAEPAPPRYTPDATPSVVNAALARLRPLGKPGAGAKARP
jgi:hypothetical protein